MLYTKLLEDNKTLDNNKKEFKLYLILSLRGEEFNSIQKAYIDPEQTSHKQAKIKKLKNRPFYRALKDGINIFGIYEIKNCSIKGKQVIYILDMILLIYFMIKKVKFLLALLVKIL